MQEEAEKNAESDRKAKEVIELKNQADSLAYAMEKTLREHGDKIDPKDKIDIEQKTNALKEALKTENETAIKNAMEELTKVSHKVSEMLYKNTAYQQQQQGASGEQGQGGNPGEAGGGEKVVDAEVVDDNNNDKK